MPAPSRLQIATSSLERLLKEENSYHKELEQGQARVRQLETEPSNDENADYMLRQEVHLSAQCVFLISRANNFTEKGSGGDQGGLPVHAQTYQGRCHAARTAIGELNTTA